MLYNIMLVSVIYQHASALGTYVPSLLTSFPPPNPASFHRAPDLSSLHHTANFHWLSNFPYGDVYVSMLVSQSIPLSPSCTVSTSLFSISESPLLPCRWVHQYHPSRFHIYVLINDTCLFFSDLLHSV